MTISYYLVTGQNYTIHKNNTDDIVAEYAEELIRVNTPNDSKQYVFTLIQNENSFVIEYVVSPDNINGKQQTDNVWNELEATIISAFFDIAKQTQSNNSYKQEEVQNPNNKSKGKSKSIVQSETGNTSNNSYGLNFDTQTIPPVSDDYKSENVSNRNSSDNIGVPNDREINILAYGKPIMGFYSADHEFDGATVEYRVITKSNPNPEFEYLGTAPFAYLTAAEAKILSTMDKKNAGIFEVRPLIVESGGIVEFRLSKNGYKTVVVKPLVKVDFGGRMIAIPLNKLK